LPRALSQRFDVDVGANIAQVAPASHTASNVARRSLGTGPAQLTSPTPPSREHESRRVPEVERRADLAGHAIRLVVPAPNQIGMRSISSRAVSAIRARRSSALRTAMS